MEATPSTAPHYPAVSVKETTGLRPWQNIGEAIRLVLDVLEDDAAVNDESILRLQVLRGTLPYSETPDLIAGEMKRILADRKKDGLSYDGVSIERVDIPATAPV